MNSTSINVCGPLSLSLLTSADAYHAVLAANDIPFLEPDIVSTQKIATALERRLFLEGADTRSLRHCVGRFARLDKDEDRLLRLLWDIGFELKKYSVDMHRRASNAVTTAGRAQFKLFHSLNESERFLLEQEMTPTPPVVDAGRLLHKAIDETWDDVDPNLLEFRDTMRLFYREKKAEEMRRVVIREFRKEIANNLYDAGEPQDLSNSFLAKVASFPDLLIQAIRDILPPYAQLSHITFFANTFLKRHQYFKAAYFCRAFLDHLGRAILLKDFAMGEMWLTYGEALQRLGLYDEALGAYQQTFPILMSDVQSDKSFVRLFVNLSDLHRAEGRFTEAEHTLRLALDLYHHWVKNDDLHLALYLYKMAVIQEGLGDATMARYFYKKSLEIRGNVLRNSFFVSASLYAKKGDAQEALTRAEKSEEIRVVFARTLQHSHLDDARLFPFCALIVYDEDMDMFRIPLVDMVWDFSDSKYQA